MLRLQRNILQRVSKTGIFPKTDHVVSISEYPTIANDQPRSRFVVYLAYLRFPGRVLGPKETPPVHMLAFIAEQLRIFE
jgi:hypothetical protein